MNDKKLYSRDKQRRETWESNLNTELIKITTKEMKERQERNTTDSNLKHYFSGV